jgi:hypothetical protein
MKAEALEMGIWNGSRVRPGTVIDWPDGAKLPKWLKPLEEGKSPSPSAKKRVDAVVRTLSEMNKQGKD